MLRHRRFLLAMHRLALIGVLMMAIAPAVSRWMQWHGAQAHVAHLVELCTGQGLRLVDLDHLSDGARAPAVAMEHAGMDHGDGMPMPAGHDGAACGYCVLAANLLPFVLLALILPLLQPASRALPLRHVLPRLHAAWPAHAARGPPLHA
ncbi:DUF2946 family protein [Pseudoxanthomonas sp. JBR18]|uniref:DUF2946 family protein n=1 Tax=Pseudoxanthomonas sp. JBR18 TaxID=2969308 RepID=UPI00230546A1|nr:DUF2946 family protein [Pseudoxanthomonas sp. JBR18]WCE05022.1 DUF2946 family protein [Pseudoxanthomonas sp. JBR18]